MERIIVVTLLLVTFLGGSFALSCLNCGEVNCEENLYCKYGTTSDVCNCCDICAQGPNEVCGGPWNISGRCGRGLYCEKEFDDFNANGKCVFDEFSYSKRPKRALFRGRKAGLSQIAPRRYSHRAAGNSIPEHIKQLLRQRGIRI